MEMNRASASAVVLTLVYLSGCATIVTGSTQGVTVESDPGGKAAIESESAKAIDEARAPFQTPRGFPPTMDARCEAPPCIAAVKPLEERRTQRLADLEVQRSAARVRQ